MTRTKQKIREDLEHLAQQFQGGNQTLRRAADAFPGAVAETTVQERTGFC
ncbi:hypothetical protein [Pseudomonas sp. LS1212]|nr:hypothetical protein [Pseudomonas sp. LS1212]